MLVVCKYNILKKEEIPNTFYISVVTSGYVTDSLAPPKT